jgi:prepilin-type N-terminal cleavage/methylation domain-containing protein
MPGRHETRGFTLVEVLAAIALTGLTISGAVMLFRQLDDESTRIRVESARITREGNARRILRALTRSAEATADTALRFRGDERSASFRSWCAVPSGWRERCGVLLFVDRGRDSSTITVQLSTGEQISCGAHRGAVEFRYLDVTLRDSSWLRFWSEGLRLPSAIGMIIERDTLLFPLGASRD